MIIPFTKVGTLAIVGLELLFDWIPISTSILAKLRKVSVYHAYPGIGSLEQVCLLYLFFWKHLHQSIACFSTMYYCHYYYTN